MNEFDLFQRAVDIEDTNARQLFLKSACSGNPALLRRVESLLESHYGQTQFLETPVAEQIIVHDVLEADEEPQSTVEHSDEHALYGESHEAHDYKYLLDYLNLTFENIKRQLLGAMDVFRCDSGGMDRYLVC